MIYYFTGTGNSLAIVRQLQKLRNKQEEGVTAIDYTTPSPRLTDECTEIGFVFPVYGWGLPLVAEDFIRRLPGNTNKRSPYIYVILTCGDDIGCTDKQVRKLFAKKGWNVNAIFSVQMRNTYICLPGFQTDPANLEQQKNEKALTWLRQISQRIEAHEPSSNNDVHPGAFPRMKSYVLRPLFNKFLIHDKHFKVNAKACIACGKCVRICPLHNIQADAAGMPQWLGQCTHCLRCFHTCPKHAIEYGLFTQGKSQVKVKL